MKNITFVLLILLVAGCVSSKRMMRLSPINKSRDREKSFQIDSDRVNLWPLMYHNKEYTSVIWPVIDIDDQGMAVRPLYNQDGDEYSVLFPFAAWNSVKGEGWVMPGYWDDDNYGVFPLFHLGNKFQYIGPFWWEDDSYGILISGITDKKYFLGPLWGLRNADHLEGGVFPVVRLGNPAENWVFPVYNQEKDSESTTHRVLFGSLAWLQTESDGDYKYWILPVLVGNKNDNSYMMVLPLGMYQFNEVSKDYCYWLLPWLDKQSDEFRTQAFFPLYLYSESDQEKLLVTPIFSYGWGNQGRTLFNVLGPIYHHDVSEEETTLACVWPLSYYHRENEYVEWCSFPLISNGIDGPFLIYYDEDDFSILGPFLFSYDSRESHTRDPFNGLKDRNLIIPNLDFEVKPKNKSWKIRSLLFFTSSHKYSPELYPYWNSTSDLPSVNLGASSVVEQTTNYFMFFGTTWQRIKSWRPEIEQGDIRNIKRSLEPQYLHKNGKRTLEAPNLERSVKILKKYNCPPKDSTPVEVCKAVVKFAGENTEIYDRRKVNFFPLFDYDGYRDYYEWDFLYILVNDEQKGKGTRRFTILKYLYRMKQQGELISRDIFPFISWDSSPDGYKFSIFWRLLNIESTKKGYKGHIFFIPF